MKYYKPFDLPPPNTIFVFGSNLAGYHGKGAALTAKQQYGARQYQGIGYQGKSYAIPTKNGKLQTLSLKDIEKYINSFCVFTQANKDKDFFITRIGCGLAGYKDNDIAPLFYSIYKQPNIIWPLSWKNYIESI